MQGNITTKPNIIWIIADQMRSQAMSFKGDINLSTPTLDLLAQKGVCFDNAVSGTPWCSPFRGAVLTSLYPHINGVIKTPMMLNPNINTITKPLKEAGYHTAYVGKWHLDGSNSVEHRIPPERRGGFDYFMGFENNNNQNETYVHGTDSEKPIRLAGYETDALNNLFMAHLEKQVANDNAPFFAVLSVQPPHIPYLPPHDLDGTARYYKNPNDIVLRPNVPQGELAEDAKFTLSGYYGMIENIDDNIARLITKLKKMGIAENTYIIFMSDHGDCHGSHGQSQKSSPYEESIRIPFIVTKLDNSQEQLSSSQKVINHIDIAPTTLGICGIDVPKEMQGYDYSSECINGGIAKTEAPQSAYLQQIVRKNHRRSINKAWRAVVTEDGWKYVVYSGVEAMMYNLNDDPYEMCNLIYVEEFSAKKKELYLLLQKHLIETKDKFVLPSIC